MYGNYIAINGISAGQLDNFGRRADGTVMLSEYGSSHGIKAAGQDGIEHSGFRFLRTRRPQGEYRQRLRSRFPGDASTASLGTPKKTWE